MDRPYSPILEGKRAVVIEDEGVTQLQMRRALTLAGLQIAGVALDPVKQRGSQLLVDRNIGGTQILDELGRGGPVASAELGRSISRW